MLLHGHISPLLSLYVQGMGLYVTITDKETIVCRLIVTVFTMNKRHLAWANLASLCQMQNINGAQMGVGDYQNDTFVRRPVNCIRHRHERAIGLEENGEIEIQD